MRFPISSSLFHVLRRFPPLRLGQVRVDQRVQLVNEPMLVNELDGMRQRGGVGGRHEMGKRRGALVGREGRDGGEGEKNALL